MPVLREDSVLIMDGAVKLYRREKSFKWQPAMPHAYPASSGYIVLVARRRYGQIIPAAAGHNQWLA